MINSSYTSTYRICPKSITIDKQPITQKKEGRHHDDQSSNVKTLIPWKTQCKGMLFLPIWISVPTEKWGLNRWKVGDFVVFALKKYFMLYQICILYLFYKKEGMVVITTTNPSNITGLIPWKCIAKICHFLFPANISPLKSVYIHLF